MCRLVDIVVVNWNSGDQIRICLESIAKHGSGLVGQTIVVDNGSIDGSDFAVDDFVGATLIRAGSNLGFARACNLGAEHAKSEYLLFLNPDAALFEDTLRKCLNYMQDSANDRVGICGVQLLYDDGNISRSCARFPSVKHFAVHTFGLSRIFPGLAHPMAEWDHSCTREVDHVIGAFFLVRRRLFEALRGFDERFFVYLEDLDFSFRATNAGWSSIFFAETQAFHAGGGTSNQVKAKRLFYSLRSRLLYAFKHFGFFEASSVLLLTLIVEPLSRSLLALARKSWTNLAETWSAYGMLWRWLPQWVFRGATR